MNIAVAGGTGFLGRSITKALLDAGHDVVVLSRSRRPDTDPRARFRAADVTDPASLAAGLAGCDAVVDAVQFPNSPIEDKKKGYTFELIDLGGTKALVDAAKAANVGLFVGLSGAGAAPDARYRWQRLKFEEEEAIRSSGVPFVVFRPSWVYGPGDVSLNRFLGFARLLPFIPIVGSGGTRINPLFVDDLSAHVAAAVARPEVRGEVFDIGGPETLTMNAIVRTALKAAGKRRPLIPQPKPLMKLVAGVVQFLPGKLRLLTPDAVDFITMDGVTDNTKVTNAFGLRLTPLTEGTARYLGKR